MNILLLVGLIYVLNWDGFKIQTFSCTDSSQLYNNNKNNTGSTTVKPMP